MLLLARISNVEVLLEVLLEFEQIFKKCYLSDLTTCMNDTYSYNIYLSRLCRIIYIYDFLFVIKVIG